MAEQKKANTTNKDAKTKKKKKNKKNTAVKAVVISVLSVLTVVFLGIFILSAASRIHKNAADKLNKSMYPLRYENYVEKYCKEFDVDKCLVYGVIKTESGFDPNATSPVGAIGLMQLMPDTFTWLQNYRTEFMPDKILDSKELYKPKLNIEYGVYLLRYLLDMYDGNTALAICAYNAGNGNIDEWLAQGIITPDNVDPDNIPFPETANYLVKVQAASEKYRELYFSDYVYTYSKVEWEETGSNTEADTDTDVDISSAEQNEGESYEDGGDMLDDYYYYDYSEDYGNDYINEEYY